MFELDYWKAQAQPVLDALVNWLQSPTFYAQIGAIVGCWLIARIAAAFVRRKIPLFRDEPAEGRFYFVTKWFYRLREIVFPVLQVAALAAAVPILDAAIGSSWLARIAQGLALVFLLYNVIKQLIPNTGLQRIVSIVVLPSALLMVFGRFDEFTAFLDTVALELGNIRLSTLFLIKAAIFGAILFWLGRQSNLAGQNAIRSQEALDLGMQELVSKIFQILLFIVIGIVFLQVLGIDLTALAVLGGAVGVGLGFGLQQIAANFISGMIILFERSLTIGDFIEMEDGKSGILKEINMRSTTLETFDGKEVMVPNEKFITTSFVNWTRADPKQRYEVEFQVSYDTDIEIVPDLITNAVRQHPQILDDPEPVDTELRSFGDSGINMAVEFWADGIDDGKNRFTADVLMIVWRTLRDANITIPFPQREVRVLSDEPKLALKKKETSKS